MIRFTIISSVIVVLVFGLFAGLYYFIYERPLELQHKARRNQERLENLKHILDLEKKASGAWPDSMNELSVGGETYLDLWQHPIVYVKYEESIGYGKIISYGKDGKIGGTGVNSDQEVRFDEKALHSEWMRFEGSKTYCRLHDTLMLPDVILQLYGYTHYSPEYMKAQRESFPNAGMDDESIDINANYFKSKILYCLICRDNWERYDNKSN